MSRASPRMTVTIREELCRKAALALNQGAGTVRVRVLEEHGQPVRAVLMVRKKNHWATEDEDLVPADRLPELLEDLELVASHGHADDVQVRQERSSESSDTDVQFRSEWLELHRGDRLASYVEGLLYGDAPAARKDVRRQIRTPHRGA